MKKLNKELKKITFISLLTLSLLIPIAFPQEQYELYIETFGAGTVTLDPPVVDIIEEGWEIYDEGTNVELTATPNSGWEFIGWGGALTGTSNPISITMDDENEVSAFFSYIDRPYKCKAMGLLERYGDEVAAETAEIVSGWWHVKIQGDSVEYRAFYTERNLDEEVEKSPEGSIDLFWFELKDTDKIIYWPDGSWDIYGNFEITKRWNTLPNNPEGYPVVWKTFERYGTVSFDSIDGWIWFWGKATGRTLKTIPDI